MLPRGKAGRARRGAVRMNERKRHRAAPGRLLAVVATLASALPWSAAEATLYEQRQLYLQAVDHLRAGRIAAASKIGEQLADYPLRPYLDYHRMRMRLSRLTAEQVNGLRREHPDLPGAQRLYRQWLANLGASHHWRAFLEHYEPGSLAQPVSAELQCYRLRALHSTGEKEQALDSVATLWVVGNSQPKACDPIFQIWQSARLTQDLAWQRLRLAIQANERVLARYLQRFFSGASRAWAQSYHSVHANPASVARTSRFTTDTALSREVIAHGLRRLAARDAQAAKDAWGQYQGSHSFSEPERQALTQRIEVALAQAGLLQRAAAERAEAPPEIALGFAQAYLKGRNWELLPGWIERLPDQERFKDKWQYWLARALSETQGSSERAERALQSLAEQRSYYGFLAANRLGLEARMNPAQSARDPAREARVRALPGIARALELFAVGDAVNARREWQAILPRLTREEQAVAAYLAQRIGQLQLATRTANQFGLRDHLHLRFPLEHEPIFRRASHATGLPLALLTAFARQESLFDPLARSPANARGVMQMLHGTARLAARRAALPAPSLEDLYDPAINIRLGSHHIAWLLRRYDDVLPFAAAAYNAGEGRADRWIKAAAGWPMDLWIEAIPFKETRSYVMNVLAFKQVYGQLLGDPLPLLHAHEAKVPAP